MYAFGQVMSYDIATGWQITDPGQLLWTNDLPPQQRHDGDAVLV